eukprot:s893_g6.t1
MLSIFGPRLARMETFRWAEKARSPAKQNVNGRLAELAQDLWSEAEAARKWALVLDAPSMSSSTALLTAGFRAQQIVVPNDSDAVFPSNSSSKALVMKGLSLNQFLKQTQGRGARARDQKYGPFSCVYCDFTQCLDGSWKPSQELEDPTLSLQSPSESAEYARHLDEDGALLAVTLAHLRSPQRIPVSGAGSGGSTDQWQRLRVLLGTLAQQRGFCGVPVERLELKAVATEQGLMQFGAHAEQAEQVVNELDVGRTGQVSYTEFLAGEQDRLLWIAWAQFRPDINGLVKVQDIQNALATRGMTVADMPDGFLAALNKEALRSKFHFEDHTQYISFNSFKSLLFDGGQMASADERGRGAKFMRWIMQAVR